MPVNLRQLVTCAEPATFRIVRLSNRADRLRDYTLTICRLHRWLTSSWAGASGRESGPITDPDPPRCGSVHDYRDTDEIIKSHVFHWLGAAAPSVDDQLVATKTLGERLRVFYEALVEYSGQWPERASVIIALEHAVRLAEALHAADRPTAEARILTALSVAETLDAHSRGA